MGVHVVAAAVLAASQVTMPDWVHKPDGDAVSEAYPAAAQFLKIEGRATISCRVADTGTLRNCETVFESPTGLGFGDAALLLAKDFQMRPLTVSGFAIDGGAVQIPLTFKLPPPDPPEPEGARPKPSKAAVDLIRQLLSDPAAAAPAPPDLKRALSMLDLSMNAGIGPDTWARVARAYEAAYREVLPVATERLAEHFAAAFTEAQLARLTGYLSGAEGEAARAHFAGTLPDPVLEDDAMMEAVRDRAHVSFCARFDCASVPRPQGQP